MLVKSAALTLGNSEKQGIPSLKHLFSKKKSLKHEIVGFAMNSNENEILLPWAFAQNVSSSTFLYCSQRAHLVNSCAYDKELDTILASYVFNCCKAPQRALHPNLLPQITSVTWIYTLSSCKSSQEPRVGAALQ
jgi:hypothetical protein